MGHSYRTSARGALTRGCDHRGHASGSAEADARTRSSPTRGVARATNSATVTLLPAPGPTSAASPDWGGTSATATRPLPPTRQPTTVRGHPPSKTHDHSAIRNGGSPHAGRRGGLGPVL